MMPGITSVTSPNIHRQTNIHRYEEATLTWWCLHLSSHTLFAVYWWILKPRLGRPPAQLPPSLQTEWRRSGFVGGKRYCGCFHGSWLRHTCGRWSSPHIVNHSVECRAVKGGFLRPPGSSVCSRFWAALQDKVSSAWLSLLLLHHSFIVLT